MMTRMLLLAGLMAALAGCSDLTTIDPPSDVIDQDKITTPEKVTELYRGSITQFAEVFAGNAGGDEFGNVALGSGMFSDEYQSVQGSGLDFDTRNLSVNSTTGLFLRLNLSRANIDQTLGGLRKFSGDLPATMQSEMYALKGYLYVFTAELFCSGIPFSKVIVDGELEYGRALTTRQMLDTAIVYFDSALATAGTNQDFRSLAAAGKARAYLNAGDFDKAAQAIQGVPPSFRYQLAYRNVGTRGSNYARALVNNTTIAASWYMANAKGINGLPYRTQANAGDPRLATRNVGSGAGLPIPAWFETAASPVTLASGIEARLIQAEAALHASSSNWLTILNALRTSGFTTSPNPDDPTVTDTTWLPGEVGMGGLRPLDDPGNESARVSLLFQERAYWLFGRGHRLGDLRRLVRQYGRNVIDVYPRGIHPSPSLNTYFFLDQYVMTPPESERQTNPFYQGCISYDP